MKILYFMFILAWLNGCLGEDYTTRVRERKNKTLSRNFLMKNSITNNLINNSYLSAVEL